MDTIAHGIWAAGIGKTARLKTHWWLLALMSMGPDLVWLPYSILTGLFTSHSIFSIGLYNISHSLVVWAALTLLAMIRWRRAIAISWPWALHILFDMIGHKHDIHTPFLWPISKYTITGWWDWLSIKWIMINYFVLACVGIFLWMRSRKKKVSATIV